MPKQHGIGVYRKWVGPWRSGTRDPVLEAGAVPVGSMHMSTSFAVSVVMSYIGVVGVR